MEEQSNQLSDSQLPLTPNKTEESKPFAKFTIRWAASIVDGLLIALALIIPALLIGSILGGSEESSSVWIVLLLGNVYMVYFTKMYGATLGKKFFKIKVVVDDGIPLTWVKAFVREVLGKIISGLILDVGYLWMLFDKRKQTWHDKIAGTIVVQEEPLSKGKKAFAYILTWGLIVIALLGIIAVFVLVAINPAEQLRRTQEAQERSQQVQEDAQRRMNEINFVYDTVPTESEEVPDINE